MQNLSSRNVRGVLQLLTLFLLFVFGVLFPTNTFAEANISCDNRYLVLINPVRGRSHWSDQSLTPIKEQYEIVNDNHYPATWLMQYDSLKDVELSSYIKDQFDDNQELGLLLEISPDLARAAKVIYPHNVAWFEPRAVFLSGYSQSERKKLINTLFKEYKRNYGYYPESVGAWWIDSYSLDYIKKKFNVKTILIVANQLTTDNYGVWGHWWGYPYYPSHTNILTPSSSLEKKHSLVVIQWAQRDITHSYGPGKEYSNYSLQANDYQERGENISYFKTLINNYLDCNNKIGQVTVGLETGMESVTNIDEYQKQLQHLRSINKLTPVTMSGFYTSFKSVYQNNPEAIRLKDNDSEWLMTPYKRENWGLGDMIEYNENLAFEDYFLADNSNFLDRKLVKKSSRTSYYFPPWFVLILIISLLICLKVKKVRLWLFSTLFYLACFGLIVKSTTMLGWRVYYGPVVGMIGLVQGLLFVYSIIIFNILDQVFRKKSKLLSLLIIISFGFDYIVGLMRYSFISGKHYFGLAANPLRFVGITLEKSLKLEFIDINLDFAQAAALLRFKFDLIWSNYLLSFVIYPLVHIVTGVILYYLLSKLPKKIRNVIIILLTLMYILYLYHLITTDPRIIKPMI